MEQEEYDALLKYIERISSAVGESDEPADRMTALLRILRKFTLRLPKKRLKRISAA